VTPRIRYCEAYGQRIPGFSEKICDLGHKIIDLYLRRERGFSGWVKNSLSSLGLKGGQSKKTGAKWRTQITLELIEKHGITPAEAARQMGIALSGVSKIIARSRPR
jgi:hypothetical protein